MPGASYNISIKGFPGDVGKVLHVSSTHRTPSQSGKEHAMARGEQPVYSSKLGLSKSPRFECLGLSCWSLGGPVVLTHTQWGSLVPGLYIFLGTPIQSLFTPPLGKREEDFLKAQTYKSLGQEEETLAGCYEKEMPFIPLPFSTWAISSPLPLAFHTQC